MSQNDWTDLSPLSETPLPEGEGSEARLQKAQEELLTQWKEREQVQRTNILTWVILALSVLVITLLIWNISLQRKVSTKVIRQVRQVSPTLKVQKGEVREPKIEGRGVEGVKVGAEERISEMETEQFQSPTKTQVSSVGTQFQNPTRPPLVPFPLPSFEPSRERQQVPTTLPQPLPTSIPAKPEEGAAQKLAPIVPSASPSPTSPPSPENIQIIGLVITDKAKVAVLRVGGRTVTVSVGETVSGTGWVVSGIGEEGVQLVWKEEPKHKIVLRPSF
ncbi:MAG: hypothetical protein QXT58_00690 [Archaeoglobaceae archaeon]